MLIRTEKQCKTCQQVKPINEFYTKQLNCKDCVAHLALLKRRKSKLNHPNATRYAFVSPTGVVHRGTNLTKFCKKNKLNYASMVVLKSGRQKNHKGWTTYKGHHTGSAKVQQFNFSPSNKSTTEKEKHKLFYSCIQLAKGMVGNAVKKYDCPYLFDDMLQECLIALLRAEQIYKPQKEFKSYAKAWMSGAIKTFMSKYYKERGFPLDSLSPYQAEWLIYHCNQRDAEFDSSWGEFN